MSDEFCYSAIELSAILKCSRDTVLRRWRELGGIQIAGSEGSLRRRRYRVIRFPRSAIERFLSKQAGHPVLLANINLRSRDSRGRGASLGHDGARESSKQTSLEVTPLIEESAVLSLKESDAIAQESGFASAAYLARHLIACGYSPEAVQWKTGLPDETVERYFKANPGRYEQWY